MKDFPFPYKSLTEHIVAELREGIFNGTYPPGAKLSISDLANTFGVSVVPVREALRNLQTEFLVDFQHNKGVTVRELTADEIRELFIIRVPLEEAAAVSAAVRWRDKDDLAQLEQIVKDMSRARTRDDWHKLHDRFHGQMFELSGLPRVAEMARVLRGQVRSYTKNYLNTDEQVALAHEDHAEMLKAIVNRDQGALRALVKRHLARPEATILGVMERHRSAADTKAVLVDNPLPRSGRKVPG